VAMFEPSTCSLTSTAEPPIRSEEDHALLARLFGSRLKGGASIHTPPAPASDDEEGLDDE